MFQRELTILSVTIDDYEVEGNSGRYSNCQAITSVNLDPSSPRVGGTIATYKFLGADGKNDENLAQQVRSAVLASKTFPPVVTVELGERVSQGKPILAITGFSG